MSEIIQDRETWIKEFEKYKCLNACFDNLVIAMNTQFIRRIGLVKEDVDNMDLDLYTKKILERVKRVIRK